MRARNRVLLTIAARHCVGCALIAFLVDGVLWGASEGAIAACMVTVLRAVLFAVFRA